MTTTELIELLKKNERGGATGRPREVMFEVDDRIIDTDGIEVTGSRDGLISELYLSLPSAQRWIPCSERLPTTKDDYIITVKDKSLTWTDYVEWSADYHWWGYDDDMVIAWMPLPEPYREDGEKP